MKSAAIYPEVILFNGVVATQDDRCPTAEAVAVGQGKIIAVGKTDDVLNLACAETEKIDLGRRLVVPGFIDTHIHFYEWALKRQDLRLNQITSLEALLACLGQAVADRPPGQWVMGQGWNESDWAEPVMPNREMLDRVAPDHPVLLWRCDLHLAVANSMALERAGIRDDTPDPPQGRIVRDAAGKPNGILQELAINLVRKAVDPPDEVRILEAFEDATKALHRRGVTGIHDVRLMADKDGASAFRAFQKLNQIQRLDLRTWVTLPGHHLDEIIDLGFRTGFGNDYLRIGHVKYFSDGGMGGRTAWMIDPYLDAQCGMPLMEIDFLAREIKKADDAGLSVMVHAVGDRANRELIDIFEAVQEQRVDAHRPLLSIPHRIEHVQMIRPEDVRRLRKLHLALCVTPANMVLDMNLIDTVVGEKGKWTYAFGPLMETGAPVMFSSDCPVCDPDPLAGIHAAVTRQRADGTPEKGWHAHNCVSVADAVKAYTATPAAVHQASDLGVIRPGNKADLTVLSENIFTLLPSRLPDIQVDMTLFDGRIVHRLI